MKTTLQTAAHDYARGALGAANEAVKAVQNAAPAGAVWPHLVEYQSLSEKATNALAATMNATGMLLNAEETGDTEIDQINLVTKVESVDAHIVHAMLEGAATRINIAMLGMPKDAKAGQRTNPKALKPKAPKKDG